jgi:hypothetical protein
MHGLVYNAARGKPILTGNQPQQKQLMFLKLVFCLNVGNTEIIANQLFPECNDSNAGLLCCGFCNFWRFNKPTETQNQVYSQ